MVQILANVVIPVVGVVLAIIGLSANFKTRKRTILSFFRHRTYFLFSKIVTELEGLEIIYNKDRVINNLILFQASIVNTGNTDVVNKGDLPLTIQLPEDFEWKNFKIIEVSTNVQIDFRIEGRRLLFNWGLLKTNEYFSFDAIIEYKGKEHANIIYEKLVDSVEILERIPSLQVRKEPFVLKPSYWSWFLLGFFTLALGTVAVISITERQKDVDLMINYMGVKYPLKYKGVSDSTIELKYGPVKRIVKSDEFLVELKAAHVELRESPSIYLMWVLLVLGIATLIFLVKYAYGEYVDGQVYKRLRVISQKRLSYLDED